MALYLDMIWLLNMLVDSLLLWMTAIFLKRSIKIWRAVTGGGFGSILIILMITPLAEFAGNPAVKLGFSVVMVLIAFGFKRFRYFLSNLLTFYFSTFLTGGILMGSHYFLHFDMKLESSLFLASLRGFGDPISWIFVMFGFPVAWYFSKRRVEDFEIEKIKYDQIVDVTLEINECKIQVKGFIDSGNQLYDPLSKAPVMMVSTCSLDDRLPTQILTLAKQPESFLHGDVELSDHWMDRIRFIPAQSIGKTNQLLPAFKPDRIIIHDGFNYYSPLKALVCFTAQSLSPDDRFSCIVHPKMVSGKIENVS
nr:sigma-E processing peptidase SpoIIGA [Oikeobacillus pervagus]